MPYLRAFAQSDPINPVVSRCKDGGKVVYIGGGLLTVILIIILLVILL
jgi:hypothetical protein